MLSMPLWHQSRLPPEEVTNIKNLSPDRVAVLSYWLNLISRNELCMRRPVNKWLWFDIHQVIKNMNMYRNIHPCAHTHSHMVSDFCNYKDMYICVYIITYKINDLERPHKAWANKVTILVFLLYPIQSSTS